jgi:hypothetical protein
MQLLLKFLEQKKNKPKKQSRIHRKKQQRKVWGEFFYKEQRETKRRLSQSI